jgi:hypothetical protein
MKSLQNTEDLGAKNGIPHSHTRSLFPLTKLLYEKLHNIKKGIYRVRDLACGWLVEIEVEGPYAG